LEVRCPVCGKRHRVNEPGASVMVFCPRCGTLFEVCFVPRCVRVLARALDEGGGGGA